jgi:hypothetical protein
MSPTKRHDWIYESEFFCAHCLTDLDEWATRCYRCNHSFHGSARRDLVSGTPHIAMVLHHG